LGLDVTAEGIETPEQLARLRELGCESGQGYLFSKPVEAVKAEALIAAQPQW
jgi:EAL domain-containing protein (putative c-di-GMP-specific phosphodiesterase class I)